MNLATRILIGLVLGIAAGLFFGERMSVLANVGQAFILLLQMTVLPYMAVSLVHGLGCLSASEAAALAKRAGGFLVLLWGLTLFAVFVTPLAFPDWEAASFFSTNLVAERQSFDFLGSVHSGQSLPRAIRRRGAVGGGLQRGPGRRADRHRSGAQARPDQRPRHAFRRSSAASRASSCGSRPTASSPSPRTPWAP